MGVTTSTAATAGRSARHGGSDPRPVLVPGTDGWRLLGGRCTAGGHANPTNAPRCPRCGAPTAEADTSTVGDFTASATDTGCPAGTAGSCTEATFAVPATFSAAGDTAAQCPPSQAQINAGLFGCAIAVAMLVMPGPPAVLVFERSASASFT